MQGPNKLARGQPRHCTDDNCGFAVVLRTQTNGRTNQPPQMPRLSDFAYGPSLPLSSQWDGKSTLTADPGHTSSYIKTTAYRNTSLSAMWSRSNQINCLPVKDHQRSLNRTSRPLNRTKSTRLSHTTRCHLSHTQDNGPPEGKPVQVVTSLVSGSRCFVLRALEHPQSLEHTRTQSMHSLQQHV